MKFNELISQDQALTDFLNDTKNKQNSLLTGVNSGALPVLIMQLVQTHHRPLLLVEENEHKAQNVYAALHEALADETVHLFSVDSTLATAGATASADELAARLDALRFLLAGQAGVVVTTPQGLQMKLSQPAAFGKAKLTFRPEQDYSLPKISQWLVNAGYNRQPLVARPGEFALRGDILDIYPLDLDQPLRIEFFGDELDAIKNFDPSTQRSSQKVEEATVLPAADRVFSKAELVAAGRQLKTELAAAKRTALSEKFGNDADALTAGQIPADYAFLIDYLVAKPANLTAYLAKNGLLLFDDWTLIKKNVQDVDQANADFIKEEEDQHLWLPGQKLRFAWRDVLTKDRHHRLYLSLFQRSLGRVKLDQMYNWPTRLPEQFFSKVELVKTRLREFAKSKQTVVLQADNQRRLRQMSETFAQYGIVLPTVKLDSLVQAQAQFLVGDFMTGFILPKIKLVYLTERELFNAVRHKRRRIKALDNAQRLRNYTELKPGDYVVHVNHGIGRFEGIKTLTVDGKKRDYITITYQHGDQLFVPADQLRLVQKYTGSEGHRPHINKLGGTEWAKTKRRVAAKVEDIADDLVQLYAKRESEKGFAFSPDNEYQREFEAAFPYEETPDQLQAAKEVKEDMEKPRPMDRLLVGDVGFGKTEVALRAAFKAIQDNKQVAFLVPTTILAQQHYQTMQDRFKNFPVNFAMLSRFQGTKESKQILAGLADGSIDIVVGTHRLLSKDVHFKDLGLLIIDEEQRFGVKHKEKLKELKANVDVLTLTATPIPRTLHMSMVGVRDLSVMETPPRNRFPIQTYVMEEMPSVVKEACRREMARNGQVFFLHNRIEDIDETTARLQKLLPEAKIEYIHGRMPQERLEDVLYRFIHNEFDILVTTTIIETGIDMPNVNTMIVENADRYGLSQLYQLRGRIGRSARLAYAYFLYQPNKVLTEVGEKRLDAIRDFTELGSGFKIAMRDLAIRGAGNMLGKQQHGFINSVGYDLYSQMLGDAIKDKQGKKQVQTSNAEVMLNLEAYIPDAYISDQEQKIEFYKRIKAAKDQAQLQEIEDELVDRFGDYPAPVESLLAIAKLKLRADWAQAVSLREAGGKIRVVFTNHASHALEGPNVFRALEHVSLRARVALNQAQRLVVQLILPAKIKPRVLVNEIGTFLRAAGKIVQR